MTFLDISVSVSRSKFFNHGDTHQFHAVVMFLEVVSNKSYLMSSHRINEVHSVNVSNYFEVLDTMANLQIKWVTPSLFKMAYITQE